MIIPWQQVDSETLDNLLEAFVLREGTDYGEHERSLTEKLQTCAVSWSVVKPFWSGPSYTKPSILCPVVHSVPVLKSSNNLYSFTTALSEQHNKTR